MISPAPKRGYLPFQQRLKLAVLCAHHQSRHTSLLPPCCKGKQVGRAVAQLFFRASHKALSYPLGLLRAVLSGKISLVHGDFLKFALDDLLLTTTCNASAQHSHCIFQRGKSILALPTNFLTHVQCSIWSTFIYLEAFLSILYNINGFIFSSPLSSQQYHESITGVEQQGPLSTLYVYFGIPFLKDRNIWNNFGKKLTTYFHTRCSAFGSSLPEQFHSKLIQAETLFHFQTKFFS